MYHLVNISVRPPIHFHCIIIKDRYNYSVAQTRPEIMPIIKSILTINPDMLRFSENILIP